MNLEQKVTIFLEATKEITKNNSSVTSYLILAFGICFVLLGIFIFMLYPKQKQKIRKYKEEQLKVFHENNPKKKNYNYESSGLFIPSWERMKFNLPIFLGLTSIIIGVFMIATKILNWV
ncbi:heme exporter protein CcmD [Mycoplasmopsis alligatoris]|uniref:Uncharacterized protein n=1 Tax=Mycoplasmopsis alligatoris A21JP2 TaxID=747682 RepID=D4XW69_9BACT|nr:heme exporter protein CcmD [Mycoplasmopsis alligatoris]EFF41412.1 conserved hypothetical protein [Mycoplasmopsis alligatoris A21JP2]